MTVSIIFNLVAARGAREGLWLEQGPCAHGKLPAYMAMRAS